jgi:thiamine-phosphate pyrophosphorylase
MKKDFLIAVITSPEPWEGEADCLEELLQAGTEKLHIRKRPAFAGDISSPDSIVFLLERLAPRWSSKLVLHGGLEALELAAHYAIPQVHGHWPAPWETIGMSTVAGPMIRLSASVHSWDEIGQIKPGKLEYVFLSPLFDSISKKGYMAGEGLLKRPSCVAPCRLIGLGGIDNQTIGHVMDNGWDGAAVLGYLWEKPEQAVQRFGLLNKIKKEHGR